MKRKETAHTRIKDSMSDDYLSRLISLIQKEIDNPKYECKASDEDIDNLLNNICHDLGLTLRFQSLPNDMVKITSDNPLGEVYSYHEVAARFRENYHFLVVDYDE